MADDRLGDNGDGEEKDGELVDAARAAEKMLAGIPGLLVMAALALLGLGIEPALLVGGYFYYHDKVNDLERDLDEKAAIKPPDPFYLEQLKSCEERDAEHSKREAQRAKEYAACEPELSALRTALDGCNEYYKESEKYTMTGYFHPTTGESCYALRLRP